MLLYIFTLNANMFVDTDALNTTRIASQVCHEWRDLMLNTPFLWARLVDLDCIHGEWNREWRHELMLRSGAAPLWVKADSYPCTKRSWSVPPAEAYKEISQFLFEVLSGNWHRIQKLYINGDCWPFPRNLDLLCSPAPQLEEINIGVEKPSIFPYDRGIYDIEHPIFDNYAPALRKVHMKDHVIDYRAPWLKQLYFLDINDKYSARDALQVLSATHNLRELRIEFMSRKLEASTPLLLVSLPHLKLVEYVGLLQEGAELLENIEITFDCSLAIHIPWFEIGTEPTAFFPLVNVFARQIQLHLRSRTIDSICVRYLPGDSIAIELETTLPGKSYFHLSISLSRRDTPVHVTILNSIAFPEFSCAKIIRFVAGDPLHPCFGSFLSCLTSVHTIFTESGTLQLLMDLQSNMDSTNDPIILLPALTSIDLYTVDPLLDNFSVDEETAAFILSRLRDGHPIATLNLNVEDMAPFNVPPNLDALTEVEGLKVTYKLSRARGTFEYICGSGDPARCIDMV